MNKHSQRYQKNSVPQKPVGIDKAIRLLKKQPRVKFDETVEAHFNLHLDKKSKEVVRGQVQFPKFFGKEKIILVFCDKKRIKEVKKAGAKYAGSTELIKKIEEEPKFLERVDIVLAEPSLIKEVVRLGKILGPKGLMPSEKKHTLREDLEEAVKEVKRGMVFFQSDETGNIHQAIGKVSFTEKELKDNFTALLKAIIEARGEDYKKGFIKSITLCSTMGRGIKVGV